MVNLIELTLTIYSDYNSASEPLIFTTRDTQRLRSLLAECHRLREISGWSPQSHTEMPSHFFLQLQIRNLQSNLSTAGPCPIYLVRTLPLVR